MTEDVRVGSCWYWSRYGPGLDSWDPANDQAIIFTRARLPECPGDPVSQGPDITAFAWEVFRSFPLQRPVISLRPWPAGITGLPTVLRVDDPVPLEHHEPLPDGTT
ncbi:MAG: hypothetical protein GWN07_12265, partial [Actinobacteria bacterium]|nr:hypothetical protein [Actinomycetota bacterium]NIT95477.1 hypothetical protein [Actinomycetota bacterium]NIV55661.1 hypothetical protein [Actinomycetota bacterium]NIX20558.1 hypothetical protein [Actinomycetota bacterium]NIX50462.1 hypothetical protein [Actinomycetota bacterium]